MILKSHNERHSYGPFRSRARLPARRPTRRPTRPKARPLTRLPADIRQSNNKLFPSENLVKNSHVNMT
ncbi:hypothetical protein DPMN_012425 [Dreissena polymorpha]|uniref:Uncharacterized protein n=1 Tax=Dreissena polymorpha TaxID=45954 RepID=A0A9D4S3C8_DREPO|nr:hypothetical protein DPMN_012425 [Dreissena polymorpha]